MLCTRADTCTRVMFWSAIGLSILSAFRLHAFNFYLRFILPFCFLDLRQGSRDREGRGGRVLVARCWLQQTHVKLLALESCDGQ